MNKEEIKAEDIGKLISDNISSAGTPIYGITGATKAIFDYIKNHSVPPHKEETKTPINEVVIKKIMIDFLSWLKESQGKLALWIERNSDEYVLMQYIKVIESKGLSLMPNNETSTPLKPLSDEEIEKVSAKYATDSETKEFDNNACHDFQNGAKWARNNFSLSVDNTVSECKECMNYRGEVEILENENSNHIMAKESSDNIIFELSEQLESEKRTNKYNQELMTDANNKLEEVIKENESLISQLSLYKEAVIALKSISENTCTDRLSESISKKFLNTIKQW